MRGAARARPPVAATVLLAVAAGACAPPAARRTAEPPASRGREVLDDLGAPVPLPERPERIVVLAPDLGQLVGLLGAAGAVVGACDACDRPEAVAAAPDVGPLVQPSVEAVVRLRPDLVLASSQGNPLRTLERLRELGVPVFGVRTSRSGLAGVSDGVLSVGRALNREAQAREQVARFEEGMERVRASRRGRPRLRACCLVWLDPPIAAGATSFIAELMDAAGADEACAGAREEEFPRLSREDVLRAAPEVVLLATGHAGEEEAFRAWSGAIGARVVRLDAATYLRPTPELVAAAEQLAAIFDGVRGERAP